MSNDQKSDREERAVDALITGALHFWPPNNISEAEINDFLCGKVELTDSEKASLKRAHEQFLSRHKTAEPRSKSVSTPTMEPTYNAMNRENATEQAPVEAREEIDRKRAELLAKLKAKKSPPNDKPGH